MKIIHRGTDDGIAFGGELGMQRDDRAIVAVHQPGVFAVGHGAVITRAEIQTVQGEIEPTAFGSNDQGRIGGPRTDGAIKLIH